MNDSKDKNEKSISFSGCAWHLGYHFGVIRFIQESKIDIHHAMGASSGSLAAILLLSEVEAEKGMKLLFEMAQESKNHLLGPFGHMTRFVKRGLKELLPDEAYRHLNGRLGISITLMPFFTNHIYPKKSLESNNELVNLALASCYIPIYYEKPVLVGRRPAIDGGLSDNLPTLNKKTITVSPTPSLQSRKIHIGPPKSEEKSLKEALFPKKETLSSLYSRGYNDARKFFED